MATSSITLNTLVDLVSSGVVAADRQTVLQLQLLNEEFPGTQLKTLYDTTTLDEGVLKLLNTPLVMAMAARGARKEGERFDFDLCGDDDDNGRPAAAAAAAAAADAGNGSGSDSEDGRSRLTLSEGESGDSDYEGDDEEDRWDEVHDRLDDIKESVHDLASTVSSSFLAMEIVGATSTVGLLLTLLSIWRQCSDAAATSCRA